MDDSVTTTAAAGAPDTAVSEAALRLPEEVRETIRLYLAELDTEWMLRHPACVHRQWECPATDGRWGENCRACFSPVTAEELSGELEGALNFYRRYAGAPAAADPLAVLTETAALATALGAALDRCASAAWPFLFPARETLAAAQRAVAELQPQLAAAGADARAFGEREGGAGASASDLRALALVWLLTGILRRGGLRCFVAHLPEGELRSPGIEILAACLERVGIHPGSALIHFAAASADLRGGRE